MKFVSNAIQLNGGPNGVLRHGADSPTYVGAKAAWQSVDS